MCCSSEFELVGSEFGTDPNNGCEGDYTNTRTLCLCVRFKYASIYRRFQSFRSIISINQKTLQLNYCIFETFYIHMARLTEQVLYRRPFRCCARIIFQRDWLALLKENNGGQSRCVGTSEPRPGETVLNRSCFSLTKGQCSKRQTILSVLAVHRSFYISICISTLPTQNTTFICIFICLL